MKARILSLAAALLLLLAAHAWAQGGGDPALPPLAPLDAAALLLSRPGSAAPELATTATYTLTWWTADAGGASYAAAGSYTLGGAAGQPDAAAARSTGAYTLRTGFWLPSCTAAAVAPTITRAGLTVTLAWTHNPTNQAYQVHRDTKPYFTPTDATRRNMITAAPWSYTDPQTVLGDPNTNYFYLLRATCAAAYADPRRVGEFDFRLTPGTP